MFKRLRKLDAEFDRMRGEIVRAFADATEHDVQALTDEAVKAARRHRGGPKDSPMLAPLVAAKADLLVTGDDDLLALRSRHPIETPTEFGSRL